MEIDVRIDRLLRFVQRRRKKQRTELLRLFRDVLDHASGTQDRLTAHLDDCLIASRFQRHPILPGRFRPTHPARRIKDSRKGRKGVSIVIPCHLIRCSGRHIPVRPVGIQCGRARIKYVPDIEWQALCFVELGAKIQLSKERARRKAAKTFNNDFATRHDTARYFNCQAICGRSQRRLVRIRKRMRERTVISVERPFRL